MLTMKVISAFHWPSQIGETVFVETLRNEAIKYKYCIEILTYHLCQLLL